MRKEWPSCVEITQTQQMQRFHEISGLHIFIPEGTTNLRTIFVLLCWQAAERPAVVILLSSSMTVYAYPCLHSPSCPKFWIHLGISASCHFCVCLGWCFVSANNFNNTFSFMWRNLTNYFAGLSPIFCIIYPGCITDTKKSLDRLRMSPLPHVG